MTDLFDVADKRILVNGVVGGQMLIDEAKADWDRIYNTNLRAIFTLSQSMTRLMSADQQGGNIINMASILGFTAQKVKATYASAKAALIQLTRSIAVEWARYTGQCDCTRLLPHKTGRQFPRLRSRGKNDYPCAAEASWCSP